MSKWVHNLKGLTGSVKSQENKELYKSEKRTE